MNTLDIQQLRLRLPGTARPVLDGVDLTVAAEETVALVGESGSGKTLTSRSVLRLLPKGATAQGSVLVEGEDVLAMTPARLRRLRTHTAAMIFQDPRAAINPLRRIGDFLTESLRLDGGTDAADADRRAGSMLEAVGLTGGVLRQYPDRLSGGMLQRVMIAAALMGDPALILADEPTTALDVTTQAEVVALLGDLQRRFGTGLLFVTHDLGLAAAISDRVYVMYAGQIAETGPADTLFNRPRHPYTAALLASTPRLDAPRSDLGPDAPRGSGSGGRFAARLAAIEGQPPSLREALAGCPFAPRCRYATAVCTEELPEQLPVAGDPVHRVACHHSDQVAGGEPR
ncbi:ABC transporter ATP-binding protein [Streptacidiphilus cavernicola]|uniref:ABC transporter ATP-binding protein n=1 Tax=Streptacidiphilus cavernicola TaxID=3342716 RepID=A0ABV6VQK8_9ACTN